MPAPVVVDVNQTWTLVAQNKETGTIYILETEQQYEQTWVDTGDPAPGVDDRAVTLRGNEFRIGGLGRPIDIYLRGVGSAGQVRVDA